VVLAADPTTGIQSANHGAGLGSATADDDRDLDLLPGYVARLAPLEYQELLLTLKEEARLKIPKDIGQDTTTSSRANPSARSRSLSLGSLRIQKRARKSIAPSGKGYAFFRSRDS